MLRVKHINFGEAVRRERGRRHLTQAEVAQELDVSPRTVQNWELTGALPQPSHRRAILAWLNGREDA